MSLALAEPVAPIVTERTRVLRLVPTGASVEPVAAPVRTRPHRKGPGTGPAARPRRLRFTAPPPARARACRLPVAVAPEPARSWHLTERGLAVVLVVAAALVAASVAVVGLTALRVTGEGYQSGSVAAAPTVVQP